MVYLILGVCILAIVYVFLRKKGVTFSSAEAEVVAKLKYEEQKALAVYILGKEDVFAEYEKIKARLEALVGLGAKLPVVSAVAPVVITPVAIPAVVVETVSPVAVAAAPQVAAASTSNPAVPAV